jgi:hypothetical protein
MDFWKLELCGCQKSLRQEKNSTGNPENNKFTDVIQLHTYIRLTIIY